MRNARTLKLVQISLLAAIVILFAAVPGLGYIPLGFTRATTLHIPVIIGSILLGPKEGALLGAVFGLTSLFNNTFNPTPTSFVFSPFYNLGETGGNFWSLVICFVPRILVGVFPYYVYTGLSRRASSNKGKTFALALAGFTGSITNTLLVMHLIYLFFGSGYAAVRNIAESTLYTVILTVIGTNGVPEAIVAMILVTAIVRAVQASLHRGSKSANSP
ncbi:MAG TPA: ECF transporter S component [Clostridia bacterium]|nr:ECF transporter S component [Clostridia bacterium]